ACTACPHPPPCVSCVLSGYTYRCGVTGQASVRCSFFDAVRHAVQYAVQVAQAQKVTTSGGREYYFPPSNLIFLGLGNIIFGRPKIISWGLGNSSTNLHEGE